jgi:CRP-like cAMP-binding protein
LIVHPVGDGDGLVATIGAGELFGDMALIDALPRAAQARAAAPSVLGVLFRSDFQVLMETHARIASIIALQLAREMGQRLRHRVDAAEAGRGKL